MKDRVTADDIIEAYMRPIEEALNGSGITPEYLAKKLNEELNAEEPRVVQGTGDLAGEFIYSEPMIAWRIRQRARMDAHKLLGHYPAEKREISGRDGNPISFSVIIGDDEDDE